MGDYKKAWLQGLLADGYVLDFAYGNAPTDIYAYLGAPLPASRVWIIGDNAGQMGTNPVTGSWEAHTATVSTLPPAEQPFPL